MISSHETIDTIIQTLESLSDSDKINYLNEKVEKFPQLILNFNGFCRVLQVLTTDDQKEILIKSIKHKLLDIMENYSQILCLTGILSLHLQEVFFDAFQDKLPELIEKSRFSYIIEFRDIMGLIKCDRQRNDLFYAVIDKLVEQPKDIHDFKKVVYVLKDPVHLKSFMKASKEKFSRFIVEQHNLPLVFLIIFNFCSDILIEFKQTLSDLIKDASDFIYVLLSLTDPQKDILFDLIKEKLIKIAKASMTTTEVNVIANLLPASSQAIFLEMIESLKNQNVKFKKSVEFAPEVIINEFKIGEKQLLRASDISNKISSLRLHSILKNPLVIDDVKAGELIVASLPTEADDQEITINSRFSNLSLSMRD